MYVCIYIYIYMILELVPGGSSRVRNFRQLRKFQSVFITCILKGLNCLGVQKWRTLRTKL